MPFFGDTSARCRASRCGALLLVAFLFCCQSRIPADDVVLPAFNDGPATSVPVAGLETLSLLTTLAIDPDAAVQERLRDVRIYVDNCEALLAKRALVLRARRSIDLAVSILDGDESTLLLVDDVLRTARARPELRVRVLVDFLSTYRQIPLLEHLDAEPNIEVRRFRPPHRELYAVLDEYGLDRDAFVLSLMRHQPKLMFDAARESDFAALAATIESGEEIGILDVVPHLAGILEVMEESRIFLKRLHAKLLLVDDRAFVVGGRNLNDLYHAAPDDDVLRRRGLSVEEHCIIDLDVAAVLDAVDGSGDESLPSPQRLFFDRLWHDVLSVPMDFRYQVDMDPHLYQTVTLEDFARAREGETEAARAFLVGEAERTADEPLPGGLAVTGTVEALFLQNNTSTLPHRLDVTRALIEILEDLRPGDAIDVVSAYLLIDVYWELDDPLLGALDRALVAAAGRGVKVRLWTNSIETSDLPSVNRMALESYARHMRWGIEIRELARHEERLLHVKALFARRQGRGDVALVGSYNLDPRSHIYDVNVALLVQPGPAATAIAEAIENHVLAGFDWILRDESFVEVKRVEEKEAIAWLTYIRDLL